METQQQRPEIRRKKFSAAEYHRMAKAGILHEDDRIELVEGELIQMAAIGSFHAACVDRLANRLIPLLAGEAIVRVQNPIAAGIDSEPEPDIAIVKPRPDFYAEAHPQPEDIFLVIEAADASIAYDRNIKLPLYAKARIPETWLVDMNEGAVLRYSEPSEDEYAMIRIFRGGQEIRSEILPKIRIAVSEILGS
jgi:Uma2 family endonuclease